MHPIIHHELWILHGHEWGGGPGSAVNAARGMYLKGKCCALEAHHHRTSEHAEPDLNHVLTTCWSQGCLCTLNPDWRPIGAKWNHGFSTLETGEDWKVENKIIIGERKVT
jgi:hypothetical protein